MAAPLRCTLRTTIERSLRCGRSCRPFISSKRILYYTCVRHHEVWFRPMLFELNRQIKNILYKYGPEPVKPRSSKENWDYNSEIFAFGKRIGEDLDESTLRHALTHSSFNSREASKSGETVEVLPDNTLLAESGSLFASNYIQAFLHHVYPKLPSEGVRAITDFLLRTDLLCHIAKHLGIIDVTQCKEFPIPEEILKTTFLAVVGAIYEQNGTERAGAFVRDFIITHLIGEDLYELWNPDDPMGLLMGVLKDEGLPPPESRLIREAGKNTYTPLYMVGVYCNQELLGWGPGESLDVAEKEAAAVAVRNKYGIPENRPPLPLDSVKHKHINATICSKVQDQMSQKRLAANSS